MLGALKVAGLHDEQPILRAGEPLERATAAMILAHGRGASAADILTVAEEVDPGGFAYLAPQAAGNTWYPYPFTAPFEKNEPWLSSALGRLGEVLATVERTIPTERIIMLGFSQGACLTLEFVARNAKRYGGVAGLTGGLIGPDGTPRDYQGSLDGTPVFLGCSDVDPHIPTRRVEEAAEVLTRLGGEVEFKFYPGMGHTVNEDELSHVKELMAAVTRRKEGLHR